MPPTNSTNLTDLANSIDPSNFTSSIVNNLTENLASNLTDNFINNSTNNFTDDFINNATSNFTSASDSSIFAEPTSFNTPLFESPVETNPLQLFADHANFSLRTLHVALQPYMAQLLALGCFLAGYALGRLRAPRSPLDRCVSKFSSNSESQVSISRSQRSWQFLASKARILLFVGLGLCGLALAYRQTVEVRTNRTFPPSTKNPIVRRVEASKLELGIFCALILLHLFMSRFFRWEQKQLADRLVNAASNKRVYVDKFFALMGDEMRREVKGVLLDQFAEEREALLEAERQKGRTLEARMKEEQAKQRAEFERQKVSLEREKAQQEKELREFREAKFKESQAKIQAQREKEASEKELRVANSEKKSATSSRSLEEDNKEFRRSLSLVQNKLRLEERALRLYKGFAEAIMSFEWCDLCYDERAVDLLLKSSPSQLAAFSQAPPAAESGRPTPAELVEAEAKIRKAEEVFEKIEQLGELAGVGKEEVKNEELRAEAKKEQEKGEEKLESEILEQKEDKQNNEAVLKPEEDLKEEEVKTLEDALKTAVVNEAEQKVAELVSTEVRQVIEQQNREAEQESFEQVVEKTEGDELLQKEEEESKKEVTLVSVQQTRRPDCRFHCLIRYHILCGKLGEEMQREINNL